MHELRSQAPRAIPASGKSPVVANRSNPSQSMVRITVMQPRALMLGLSLVLSIATGAQAQDTTSDGRKIVPRDTADAQRHKTLFTYRDAALAGGFAVLTVAMFPVDRHIA